MASAIHKRALEEMEELDNVIWVSIKHGSEIKDIQEEIARQLCADISGSTDDSSRAFKLHAALTSKKFFLVLDNIPFWHDFELSRIGIPESGNDWKLIVTSTSYTACSKLKDRFGNNSTICEIKPLSEDEGWKLFSHLTGPKLESIKNKIYKDTELAVKNVDGLPSAIKMLAKALREIPDNNPTRISDAWNRELLALSSSGSLLGNKSKDFFYGFKDILNDLGEVAVSCFLYCLLFPKDYYILKEKELIEYWMWDGLLGEVSSLEETMGVGKEVLDNLRDAHLLEIIPNKIGGRDEVSVKMLNVLRLVAMDALKLRHGFFFINCGKSLKEIPAAKDWPADTKRASFIQNEVHALQFGPDCKNLSTLLLQHNPLNSKSHKRFFSNLINLRTLDLSHTRISSLPNSLSALKSLHALLLHNCQHLTSLPSLSDLQNLLVLDLSRTSLQELPRGLNNLTNLRRLDLSQMTKLQVFRAEEVGKLTQIEELLLIPNSEANLTWGSNHISPVWKGPCIEELVNLRRLVVLQLNFTDAAAFEKFLKTAEFEKDALQRPQGAGHSFKFCVGDSHYNGDHVGDNSLSIFNHHKVTLPEETAELHWISCAQKLPSLQIDGCFKYLIILDISKFDELEYVLTWEMLMNLEKLKEIHVQQCRRTVSIIKPDSKARHAEVIFPELTTLVLHDLPNLRSICDCQVLNVPSLQRVDVLSCGILKLPKTLKGGNDRLIIKGDNDWLENVERSPPNFNSTFIYEETSQTRELFCTAASTSKYTGMQCSI